MLDALRVAVPVDVGVELWLGDALEVSVCDCEGDCDELPVGLGVGLVLGVPEALGDALPLGVSDWLAVADVDAVELRVSVRVLVTDRVWLCVPV